MTEHHQWHLERYQDEMDPFGAIQFYVMQGTMMLAQCDVEAHATLILSARDRLLRYQQALEQIAAMSPTDADLASAINVATEALQA